MKKIIALLSLAGILYADAANATCSCTAKKKVVKRHHVAKFTGHKKKVTNVCSLTKVKHETVSAFTGYRELPVRNTIIYETIREGVGYDPNSGVGRNSSDNYHGLVNNGSMGANGNFQNGTCEMWISSLDEKSSERDIAQAAGKCYR